MNCLGNSGVGEAIVRALAPHNPRCIYLCARRTSSGDQIVNSIHEEHPDAKIDVLELDLSSFDSIKKCAAKFDSTSDRLDLLFLNAGIAATPAAQTKEGYESQFGGMQTIALRSRTRRADDFLSQPRGPRASNSTSPT